MNKTTEALKLQEPVTTDLMDMLRLIETIKYLRGIAERGLGREIRDDETIEQFVLGYVKQLEAAPVKPVKQEPVAWGLTDETGEVLDCISNHYKTTQPCTVDYDLPLYAAPLDAKAIRTEALEEAAKVCDERVNWKNFDEDQTPMTCAAAIRGLK